MRQQQFSRSGGDSVNRKKARFEEEIKPSKLEVAPPPKCLSGVGEWVDTP